MPMKEAKQRFTLTLVLKPSEDIPGRWVSHCLDMDVVSEGDKLSEAMGMISEAAGMTLTDDLNGGRNPLARRAPKEFWDELDRIVETGTPVTFSQMFSPARSNWKALTCQLNIHIEGKMVAHEFTKPIAQPKP